MASMMLPPSPMDVYQPGLFRIAGFGGAALFLRSGVHLQYGQRYLQPAQLDQVDIERYLRPFPV